VLLAGVQSLSLRESKSLDVRQKAARSSTRYPPQRNSGMTRRGEQLTARSMDFNEMKIFDEVKMNTSV
jgi:hypothetical protein